MGEPNQVLWRGIRSVEPLEYIPITTYPPGTYPSRAYHYANNSKVTVLQVPSGSIYRIVNIWGNINPIANGSGNIVLNNSSGTTLMVLGEYRVDDYRVVNNGIGLMAPIFMSNGELISVYSSADGFYVYCTLEYTEE